MLFARQTIVNAAGAYGLQSLDLVRTPSKGSQLYIDATWTGMRELSGRGRIT